MGRGSWVALASSYTYVRRIQRVCASALPRGAWTSTSARAKLLRGGRCHFGVILIAAGALARAFLGSPAMARQSRDWRVGRVWPPCLARRSQGRIIVQGQVLSCQVPAVLVKRRANARTAGGAAAMSKAGATSLQNFFPRAAPGLDFADGLLSPGSDADSLPQPATR
jgi:hypothetical protein